MIAIAAAISRFPDANPFLRTHQSELGNAWRYELVRGVIAAHAAPGPGHGTILGNLAREIGNRLRDHPESWPEVGSSVASHQKQRDTGCIPDALIRCGDDPRVLFEVVSPSELRHKRQWDQIRADLQD